MSAGQGKLPEALLEQLAHIAAVGEICDPGSQNFIVGKNWTEEQKAALRNRKSWLVEHPSYIDKSQLTPHFHEIWLQKGSGS